MLFCVWHDAYKITLAVNVSMVRVFAHGAIGHQINPSWWTHSAISRSSHWSMTGVPKVMVCVILYVHIK